MSLRTTVGNESLNRVSVVLIRLEMKRGGILNEDYKMGGIWKEGADENNWTMNKKVAGR